jgi:hypothetical protein
VPHVLATKVVESWLEIELVRTESVRFILVDGLLLENGMLVKYYTNDNLIGEPVL